MAAKRQKTDSPLWAWRQRMGWTQAVAADRLGVTHPYYRELESGRQELRLVYRLAAAAIEHGINPLKNEMPPKLLRRRGSG